MAYPLNNVEVDNDSYDAARTLTLQVPSPAAFVAVFNQSVYVQVGRVEPTMRADTAQFLPEEFFVPGAYSLNRGYLIGAIRFRRVAAPVSGEEARVTAR